MSLCLAAGALLVSLGASEITLSWRHSVQKTLWEEVWRAEPGGVRLVEARIQGSGAGMDPPPDAVLRDGFWRWTLRLPVQAEIVMRRSGATADWRVCSEGRCRPMGDYLPEAADPVTLRPCG
ncbi:hypothetical protein ASG72_06340 [Bosea sp. Leaf344]|uniref:DUF1850 domain-containing protein n=1 Tax=Bosea sp. Leaf344 TaxID=1736346 RepID=UPI0006FED9E2|nr:DUF1850 domain-containing protein [Bosea sp. Leaf344]KQU52547.1 hypothetical protein ASG72_06340 [Bosea sp. Leaf344]